MRTASDLKQLRRGEVPSADFVPLGALVRHDVVKLRGKTAYAATWRLGGVPFETSTPDMVAQKMEVLASLYRNLTGGSVSYWVHRIGRKVNQELSHGAFTGFAKQIDERYTAWQGRRGYSLFENYLTLVFHPPVLRAPTVWFRRKVWFLRKDVSPEWLRVEQEVALKQFDGICQQAEASLSEFDAVRLGAYVRAGREYSELGTFYGFLLNGFWREQPIYRASLRNSLPQAHLHFGDRNGRLQINDGDVTRFVGLLEVVDYPPDAYVGDLDPILSLGVEFIETHSFTTMDKMAAAKALQTQFNQLISGEEASQAELEAMEASIEEARDGRVVTGSYHFGLSLFGGTLDEVQQACGHVRRECAAYRMEDCRLVPEALWYAQLPGNWDYRPRVAVMTSLNFAGLAPMHTPPTGKLAGNPWGEAVAILRGASNQPFAFNFHVSPRELDSTDDKNPGNTVIFGITSTGKTAMALFLGAQALRFNARIFFLDKDRGAEIALRALGGSYTLFRRGEYTGLNPFQWDDSEETKSLCRKIVTTCIRRENTSLSANDELAITQAVNSVFSSLRPESRRLSAVDQFLPRGSDNRLSVGLRKWIGEGHAAWVLDSPMDTLGVGRNRIFGVDYTVFLDDAELRDPVMLALIALRDRQIDGTPFISFMDEGWKAYESEVLADDEKNKQKTGRKESMINVLMTQSVSDATKHRHARTLIEQTVTKIFLPNPDALREEYCDTLGRTPKEFELIKGLGVLSRKALVCQGRTSVLVDMDLSGLQEELVALSGSLDNVRLLDQIRIEHGDDPEVWMPLLLQGVRERKARKTLRAA